jgi:branched-chain amino acid transport system ATP-binding protein
VLATVDDNGGTAHGSPGHSDPPHDGAGGTARGGANTTANGTANSAALTVEDLSAGYGGILALDRVSLSAAAGTITAVLGANGAGKTTLLATISGLVRNRGGHVRLNGADTGPGGSAGTMELTGRRPEDIVRAGVSHVPEGRGVIAELTVEENLKLGALWRRGRAERAAALGAAYEMFPQLAERRRRLAATLSGGERQMLALGRALMAHPRVLLLDEPSLGLAPRIVAEVMTLIRKLRDETGLTVLLVEQNARGALAIADYGIVLNLGRVAAAADAADLAADTTLRHHYLGF